MANLARFLIGLTERMFSLRLSTGKKNKVYLPEPPFPHAEVSVYLHQTISLIKSIHIVCALSLITLKYLFLVITKITVMFQIVIYMQTLKYMLKIILLPDYYPINYLQMLCNNFI